uniref:Dystrophin n=1 Tax=Globodera pallida TaxID=36090 RepID=A0A183CP02_GLOPA
METVVIKRWEKLNEWVEQREKVLDEIEKLLEQYEQNSEGLSRWLDNQLDELQNLQTSEDQLEGGEEVQERLDELSQLGKTLEAQQEALVRLSQVCTELAAKFEKGANAEASAKVRHRLDNVTHKWDQIVAGLEEHSEKLIRSGKVRLGGSEDEAAGNGQKRLERLQTIISMDESAEQQQISPQMKRRKQLQQSMEQFLVEVPEEMPPTSGEELKFGIAETPSTSTKCLEGEEQANPDSTAAESLSPTASSYTLSPPQQTVTNFLKKVAVVDQKIGPLVEWAANAETTPSGTSKGNVRQMVLTCQKKLDDMRELEPEMTKLQILLEHIHNRANLNAKQLHVVNEMFDIFMSRWSKVVATISQLLSALSKPEPLVPKKMSMQNKDKEGRVAKMVEQFEQQTQLSQVKRLARFTEEEKGEMEVMEREMVELLGRIDQARKEAERCERALKMPTTTVQMRRDDSSPELAKFQPLHGTSNISPPPLNEAESLRQKLLMEEAELANREEVEGRKAEGNEWAQWLKKEESQLRLTEQCVPGDLNKLLEELEKCDKMIIELRKRLRDASTSESDPEMIGPFKQLLRTAETKRNHSVKMEEVGDKFKRELDWLRRNSEETSPKDTEEKLRHLKEALNAQLGSKTEAVQLLDDLTQSVASAAGENAPVVKQMQLRMSKLDQQWLSISAEIEELLLCCAVERQKRADSWLTTKEEIVQELELAIRASFESATDAEELSEHLDNLERLLDRMNSLDEEAAEEGTFTLLTEQSGNISQILRTRGDALANAVQERCAQLRNAVTRCEHFEQKLCKMQGWCTLIHQILNQRFAPDTSALEVPHEYKDAQRTGSLFKQVDKEFVEFDALVNELEQYIGQSKFEFASTERLRLQLNHANEQIEQLRSKYGEFKQPITLYEKMERIQKQLEEANSSMKDLNEEIQAENCEFFVLHARQIAVQLQDLGSECAACEVARDTLIREGILEEEQALNISTRLGQLNAKCVEELEPKALRAVHRFERAAELLQKLEREKAVMDKLAKEAENRVGEGKNHPLTIKAMDELNRQVKAASDAAGKTKELEQLLKQLSIQLQKDIYESIAVTEQKCAQLKEQIDQWAQRTAEEGPAQIDEEKVLAEVAAMAQTLGESIGRVEAMLAEGQLDATFLEQQLNDIQPEKERFERKTLELLDNTEYRKRVAPALADLTFRWQRLSARSREAKKKRKETKKSREPEELEKETERASPSPGKKAEEAIRGSNFGLKVQTMIEVFENAAQQLNFQKRPLSSLKEWEQRLSHSNQFVTTQKLRFDELIAEGKRLAESGPMELEVSAALAKLDKLIELVHQLDKQIESQEDRLFWTNKQLAKLDEQAELVRERMDTLERRTEQLDKTATDQTPIIVS